MPKYGPVDQPRYTIIEAKRILTTAIEIIEQLPTNPDGFAMSTLTAGDILTAVVAAVESDAIVFGTPGATTPRGFLSVQP